jgi:hypothetical protein
MSPQTFPEMNRDDRKPHSVTRSPARALLRHDMTVIASSVTDVIASAGGWLFDRRMAGWSVDVLVADRGGERALEILGAHAVDLDEGLDAISGERERAETVVVAADVYAVNDRVRQELGFALDEGIAEVAVWGDTDRLGQKVSAVSYRLSAAARAFKSQALLAAGMPSDSVAPIEALFRCGVTALAPVAARP